MYGMNKKQAFSIHIKNNLVYNGTSHISASLNVERNN